MHTWFPLLIAALLYVAILALGREILYDDTPEWPDDNDPCD